MVIIRLQRQEQGVLYNVFRKEAALMSVKETKLVFKRFKRKAVSVLTKKILCPKDGMSKE